MRRFKLGYDSFSALGSLVGTFLVIFRTLTKLFFELGPLFMERTYFNVLEILSQLAELF